jgi:hypothetical protein
MRLRFLTLVAVLFSLLLVGTSLALWGCGADPSSVTFEPAPVSSPVTSAVAPEAPSFEEAWSMSLAALEALGPTRVSIVETIEGRAQGEEIPLEQSDFGPQTEEAEQLFDVAQGRARLTVHTSDHMVKTTVVHRNERTSTMSQPSSNSDFVSVSRYISLQAPEGLPLPLWAGNAVSPTEGYPDLLEQSESGGSIEASDGTVEQADDGSARLSWQHFANGVTSASTLLLDADHLPVRLETAANGTPEEGDLQGITIEYTMTIVYEYEQVASFTDSDFLLDVPPGAYNEGVTYELALDRPRSAQADWGQYWLGPQLGEWPPTRAEYAVHGGSGPYSEGEPSDEAVFLLYDRPNAASPNDDIQVITRPLRGRYLEDARTFAEQRVTSGDWVRREMTLAGQPAMVYSGALEGGADDRIDSIYVFLPDAFVNIQVWAPIDPLVVLGALSPVE